MTDDFAPVAGKPYALRDDLMLVLAPNASPMTYLGTNTYIIGRDIVAVIDPGPDDAQHLTALTQALGGRSVTHIFVTHSHLDHAPLAAKLSAQTGASICAFGDSTTGRSRVMQDIASQGLVGGGEGVDHAFRPDRCLHDGEEISAPWGKIAVLHTPGHMGNHLCFLWDNAIFTGDHVMGWASSLVSPPDGDLTDFMMSCTKLQALHADVFYPGHGAPVTDPQVRLNWLISHRRNRETQILELLSLGAANLSYITTTLYADVGIALQGAAARNVFAHLIDLNERGLVRADPVLCATATFEMA